MLTQQNEKGRMCKDKDLFDVVDVIVAHFRMFSCCLTCCLA